MRSSPIRSVGAPTTPSGTRVSAPAASRRARQPVPASRTSSVRSSARAIRSSRALRLRPPRAGARWRRGRRRGDRALGRPRGRQPRGLVRGGVTLRSLQRERGRARDPDPDVRDLRGQGVVQRVSRTPFGQMVRTTACPTCNGEGKIPDEPCHECDGAGRIRRRRTWDVDVPAGIEDGQRIRIAGAGHAGEQGPGRGSVRRGPDPRGRALRAPRRAPVDDREDRRDPGDARGRDPGPHPGRAGPGRGPEGAQPGQRVVIRGQGLPALHGGRRGDQHVVLDVVVPARLSRKQRAAVELDALLDDPPVGG